MSSIQHSIQSSIQNSTRLFFLLAATLVGAFGSDSSPLPPSITTAPLSVDQVVNNLVRKDEERARLCVTWNPPASIAFPIADSRAIATPK